MVLQDGAIKCKFNNSLHVINNAELLADIRPTLNVPAASHLQANISNKYTGAKGLRTTNRRCIFKRFTSGRRSVLLAIVSKLVGSVFKLPATKTLIVSADFPSC